MSLKQAFNYNNSSFGGGVSYPTIEDFLREIRNDPQLTHGEKMAYITQLNNAVGNIPKGTPIVHVLSLVAGGVVANLAAKYFNMGMVGRGIATAVGAGLGSKTYNRISQFGLPGWS